ncbi:MAG: hypothetical protein IT435_04150 [Phycisphaerales bacterium]|nr:hypothetical protein [Phycisphaerales bacterium]
MDRGPQSILYLEDGISPGNSIALTVESEHIREVFCGLGELRKSAEQVAGEAIDQVREYLADGVPVGRYLADQLMVPMAIAAECSAGESSFVSLPLSRHASTNSDIIERFLERKASVVRDGRRCRWSIGPA